MSLHCYVFPITDPDDNTCLVTSQSGQRKQREMLNPQVWITAGLIGLGAGILSLAMWNKSRVLRLLRNTPYQRAWRGLFVLTSIFLAGYLAALALVLTRHTSWLVPSYRRHLFPRCVICLSSRPGWLVDDR